MLNRFDRPVGVICFETDVLEDASHLPFLLGQLFNTGLAWQWSSSRRYPVHPAFARLDLPERRDYTRLTPSQLSTLQEDLTEQDMNDDCRSLELIGADIDLLDTLRAKESAKRVMANFVRELPPIRLVLARPGDTGSCHIFLPHQPSASVVALLAGWGIDPAKVTRRWPYRRLHLARLESMFGLEGLS
ncbi:MAG: hypothetical protein CVU38_17600 [Chloroflexi bacterium HGW-Chloroflexi-1]|nr:MAG: hypothetical protein CVU38_17600 [Chloroflexi bacterium HGW-Chloroflexi-1]